MPLDSDTRRVEKRKTQHSSFPCLVLYHAVVDATDEAGNWAAAPFQVSAPFMTLTPDTAVGSSIVTANGWGFPPNTPILLYLEDLMLVDLVDLFSGGQALLTDEYGFYNFSFVIPVANPGTYAVTAYRMETPGGLQRGETVATAFLTVVENPLLTEANARLVGLEGTVATINSTLGVFQTNLANIELNVTAIKGDTATIETTLGTIEGRIVSIEGDTATIETEVGTVKADVGAVMADVSKANDTLETFIIPLYIGLALALIAAVGAIILVVMHANALRKTSTKSVNS